MIPIIRRLSLNYLDSYTNLIYQNENEKNEFKESVNFHFNKISKFGLKKYLIIGKVQSGKTRFFLGFIARSLEKNHCVVLLTGTTISLHNQTIKRIHESFGSTDITILDSRKNVKINSGTKYIICCLKNASVIKKTTKLLAANNFDKCIVIDDESDQASLNSFNYVNFFSDEFKATPTNQAIHYLIESTSNLYVQITATPAAHILTEILDDFSPDAIGTITPHNNYIGNNDFFNNRNNNVVTIKRSEDSLIQFLLQYATDAFSANNNHPSKKNFSALVLSETYISKNETIYNKITLLIEYLSKTSQHIIRSHFPYACSNFDTQQFEEAKKILTIVKVQRVFEKHDNKVNWELFFQKNRYFILIGGNKISRGFTVEGLITTYLTRDSKSKSNGDTVQQRARFFGSKRDILTFCKVFMTNEIKYQFEEYRDNENRLFETLDGFKLKKDINFDYAQEITNPTRKNVISLFNARIDKTKFYPVYCEVSQDNLVYNIIISESNYIENIYSSHLRSISVSKIESVLNKYFCYNRRQLRLITESLKLIDGENLLFVDLLNENGKIRQRASKYSNTAWRNVPETIHQGRNSNYIGDAMLSNNSDKLNIHLSLNYLPKTQEFCLSILFKYL